MGVTLDLSQVQQKTGIQHNKSDQVDQPKSIVPKIH